MERLSLAADPESQAALNSLLDRRALRKGRLVARNLTTTAGLTNIGATYFPNGSWFVFPKGAGSVSAADTMASHAAWSEITAYQQPTRVGRRTGSVL
jgi:hypothetical protein